MYRFKMLSEVNKTVLNSLMSRADSDAPVVRDFWKFLMICFQTPRPSTNYDGVVNEARSVPFQNAMRGVCADHGLRYLMDKVGNIIIKNFLEDGPKARFCFQGHSDVVVSKNESVVHNFETDGIDVQITSEGTVKNQRKSVYRKLGIVRATQLAGALGFGGPSRRIGHGS